MVLGTETDSSRLMASRIQRSLVMSINCYFNQLLQKAYDFDTMKSMLVHNKPLKKIDWYNTSFRTLAPAKLSPNDMSRVSPPDWPIKREIPAETPLIRETHFPYVSFEISDTKMTVNTSSDEDINSIKKGVKFGVDINSISPRTNTFPPSEYPLSPDIPPGSHSINVLAPFARNPVESPRFRLEKFERFRSS
jgi:hypothetical protein